MKILQVLYLCLFLANCTNSCHLDQCLVEVNITQEKLKFVDLSHSDNQLMNFNISSISSKSAESIQRKFTTDNDNLDKQKSDNIYNKKWLLKFFVLIFCAYILCLVIFSTLTSSQYESSRGYVVINNNKIQYETISGSLDEDIWKTEECDSDIFYSFHFNVEENGFKNMAIIDATGEEISNEELSKLLEDEEKSEISDSDSLVVISIEDEF
ncbi:uncharacterized protein LOC111635743 [Centruroides sculpturatus]|uniref:uncharacterized protein LOC111635743 n=1 Tax=Centruroides sculpturatus TaxID=218467 RepID=UPI000C6D7E1B|nr:uncharacterized protein LOC111635743 [Centruroides sculpturatus]